MSLERRTIKNLSTTVNRTENRYACTFQSSDLDWTNPEWSGDALYAFRCFHQGLETCSGDGRYGAARISVKYDLSYWVDGPRVHSPVCGSADICHRSDPVDRIFRGRNCDASSFAGSLVRVSGRARTAGVGRALSA